MISFANEKNSITERIIIKAKEKFLDCENYTPVPVP